MSAPVSFEVRGIPASKGSPKFGRNRRTGGRHMIPQSARLVAWNAAVWAAAIATKVRFPAGVPLAIRIVFRVKAMRGDAPGGRPCRSPYADGDKLERATWDALQHAGMIADDAQFCSHSAEKFVAQPGHEGATIAVWAL
jgi:Holliday junction resolvase RusA-like endonuclease